MQQISNSVHNVVSEHRFSKTAYNFQLKQFKQYICIYIYIYMYMMTASGSQKPADQQKM